MFLSKTLSGRDKASSLPAYLKVRQAFFATSLIVGPLLMIIWLVFYPARTAVTASEVIAANMRVGPDMMARMGGGQQLITLWNQFNTDPLITVYLFIFIIGYLSGPVLLAIALGQTHVIPAWAAWAIILRSPIQVVGFVTHIGLSIEIVTYGLLLLGSVPVALALLRYSDAEARIIDSNK